MAARRRFSLAAAIVTMATVMPLLDLPLLDGIAAQAQEPLTVVLSSGRSFTGMIDERTDDERLWLRYGTQRTTILRPIAWERVESAQLKGELIEPEELRSVAETLKSAEPRRVFFQRHDKSTGESGVAAPQSTSATAEIMSQRARQSLGSNARIQSVQFDAYLANWDADVEADGLVVNVRPINSDGQAALVDGTLQVELMAFQGPTSPSAAEHRGQAFSSIARWTKLISTSERGEIEVQLPFQTSHPEFDTNISPHGLVNLKFVAPGHGVFERSIDSVRIRPYSSFRDALERSGHDRFLPGEHTSRN